MAVRTSEETKEGIIAYIDPLKKIAVVSGGDDKSRQHITEAVARALEAKIYGRVTILGSILTELRYRLVDPDTWAAYGELTYLVSDDTENNC